MYKTNFPIRTGTATSSDFGVWLKVGLLSFGGPAAQIALMHQEIVEKRHWLSEKQYLNALSFCMLLPGPEAMQLATYVGWRRSGFAGGLIAGLCFIGPGALVILALAMTYVSFGESHFLASLFSGIKAAVIIIVLHSLIRIIRHTMNDVASWVIAVAAFTGIFFLDLPFPLILVSAGLVGFFGKTIVDISTMEQQPNVAYPSLLRTSITAVVGFTVWFLPFLGITMLAGETIFLELAIFFTKLAVFSFGGAYAALAYMGQEVVNNHHWLSTKEMVDGLGLAETTPGPLILVTEFVGFIVGFRDTLASNERADVIMTRMISGGLGALITLWATFAPCFFLIFITGPYVEWIVTRPRLKNALSCITAAIVGVIANLSVWFSVHVFFTHIDLIERGMIQMIIPDPTSVKWNVLCIALVCGILLIQRQWNSWMIIAIAAALGLGFSYF